MTDSDRKIVGLLLTRLAEVFNTPLSSTRLSGYVEALADHALATVQRMCSEAARTCKRFPSPAELRDLARPTGAPVRALPAPDGPRVTRAQMLATLRAVLPQANPRLQAAWRTLIVEMETGHDVDPRRALLGVREPGEDDGDERARLVG